MVKNLSGKEPALSNDEAQPTQQPRLGGEAALAHLTDALNDPDPAVKERAIDALSEIGSDAAVDRLLEALESGNTSIRYRAIRALGAVGNIRGTRALLALMETETFVARGHIAEALGYTRSPEGAEEVAELFLKMLYREPSYLMQISAVRGFARLYNNHPTLLAENFEHLIDDYLSGQTHTHLHMNEMLPHIDEPNVSQRFIAVATDTSTHHSQRVRAVHGLKFIRDKSTTDTLMSLLEDDNGYVSRAAEQALKVVRDRNDLPAIIDLLEHDDWQIRRRAAGILGVRKVKAAIEKLIPLLQDSRAEVRYEAAQALGRIEAAQALEALLPVMRDDKVYRVRSAASLARGRIIRAIQSARPRNG